MRLRTNHEKRLVQYLLGQMGPEEQARIEEQYLADPELHQELRATERDLIDQYVHGELSKPEEFERSFLSSPSRRQKVEFARALMRSLAQAPVAAASGAAGRQHVSWLASWRRVLAVPNRAWQPAVAMVVILAGGWLALSWQRDPADRVARTPPPLPDQGAPASPAPATPPQPDVTGPPLPAVPPLRVATFVLMPSSTRGADETPTLIVERDAEVRLELHLDTGGYGSYRAVLRTAEGDERWSRDGLMSERTTSGEAVVVRLPAGLLTGQDYTIRLSGVTAEGEVDEVSGYYFRVQSGDR